MDKIVLLKYAAILSLILFLSFIGLGLVLDVNILITCGLLLFAVGSGLLTYYFVSTKA
ncbi:MAG: hypothetical protein ACQCN5_13900 [Candidatus Bathyarchaeia archaeon]